MSFQPILPMDGYVGWRFLQRTLDSQQRSFAKTPAAQRDETYFRETIGTITSAKALVQDRRLLRVTLTAFGLQDDLPNRAYVQKVLESSVYDDRSFANRLADKRYLALAKAFSFADRAVPRNQLSGFADTILTQYRDRSFEIAVGDQNDSMRMALALGRDLGALAAQDSSEATRWYTVLGTPNLRQVFETAYHLPSSFGTLDIEQQVEILKTRTERLTGSNTIAQFTDPEAVDALTRRFFLIGQVAQIQASGMQNTALTLLQTGQASLKAMLGR